MREGRWGEPTEEPVDFFDAKGLLEETWSAAAPSCVFRASEEYRLLRGRTAELHGGRGPGGRVRPGAPAGRGSRSKSTMPVYLFELDVEKLLPAVVAAPSQHEAQSRFPAVIQDIALLIDAAVPAARRDASHRRQRPGHGRAALRRVRGRAAAGGQALAGLPGELPVAGEDAHGRGRRRRPATASCAACSTSSAQSFAGGSERTSSDQVNARFQEGLHVIRSVSSTRFRAWGS